MQTALRLALCAACLTGAAALRNKGEASMSDWAYYPPGAKVGIVTGGYPSDFVVAAHAPLWQAKPNYAAEAASIMFKYAQMHNYAFFVAKNLSEYGPRHMYWNKVMIMHKLLREVNMLVWMDPHMVIQQLDTTIEQLISTAKCSGTEQPAWKKKLPEESTPETFLYLNSDKSPHQYVLNANTGMIIIKRSPLAFELLSKVWDLGNSNRTHYSDPNSWIKKGLPEAEKGWPFEQGAFWTVLTQEQDKYLDKVCIAKGTHFHSVRPYLNLPGTFAYSFYGAPHDAAKNEALVVMARNHIKHDLEQ